MNDEKKQIKAQLDRELQEVKFTKQQKVLNRTHPISFKQRLLALWNKELEVPLLPVSSVIILTFLVFGMFAWNNEPHTSLSQRELVEAGGNTYWKDELEKVVVLHEGEN
ncbi:hypothetical protein [Bacillus sp. B15-48]|uniref:hypothetical protein n=1 Tax=Bacillus sp. B15-48 TaxID=1548601 RepID=UPI00193F301D|nr:hypothetical protein [Bacillus sp. B15-48]MBM4764401.1 hypothetical protein [Bacillus sp. B15-48]